MGLEPERTRKVPSNDSRRQVVVEGSVEGAGGCVDDLSPSLVTKTSVFRISRLELYDPLTVARTVESHSRGHLHRRGPDRGRGSL